MKKLGLLLVTVAFVWMIQASEAWAVCVAGDVTPPTKVADLKFISKAATAIVYAFTAPPDASTLAEIDLRWRTGIPLTALNWTTATQVTGEPSPAESGTTQVASLSGLSPETTYWMAVKVKDECGKWSAISNVISFSTPELPLPTQEFPLTFSWSKNTDGVTTGYIIYYGDKSRFDPTFQGYQFGIEVSGGVETVTQNINILPGEHYFTITAKDANGDESGYGNEVHYSYF